MQVRVLVHIGDACIRKLNEVRVHIAANPEIELPAAVPPSGVRTVEHMVALMRANQDNQTAEKKLFQGILNMNEVRRRRGSCGRRRGPLAAAPAAHCLVCMCGSCGPLAVWLCSRGPPRGPDMCL